MPCGNVAEAANTGKAGDAEREVEQLAGHAEPRAEGGTTEQHDHRLQRERHRA